MHLLHFILLFLFLITHSLRRLTQALQRTEQNLVWWSPGYIKQRKTEVVTADSRPPWGWHHYRIAFRKETGKKSEETSWILSLMFPIWQGQTLGFCRAPTDNLDWSRRRINKAEMNSITFFILFYSTTSGDLDALCVRDVWPSSPTLTQ